MNEETDEVFPFAFYNHGQEMRFEAVKLDGKATFSPGVFLFVNRIGTRNIKQKIEPDHKFLGIYFFCEKHQIESMIKKFKEKGANYLFLLNSDQKNSNSIIQFVRTSINWTNEDLIKID